MKKIIISALAAMSLVACVQEEVVTVNQSNAIAFENAFVDNATRAAADPSTTTASIEGFNVYGFMDEPAGVVFQGDPITKVGGAWTYTETQYWTPNHTYYFAAVSPIAGNWALEVNANTDGPGVLSFTNVNGSEDLLYAATSVDTPRELDMLKEGMDPVKFQFNHLLSKVKFTFTNGFATSNASVKVSNVTMKAAKTGTLALNTPDWWVGDKWDTTNAEKEIYAFGNVDMLGMGATNEAYDERLIIPAGKDYEFEVSFDVTLYMGTVDAMSITKTATVTGVALEMGKAYNFKAEINPENLHLPSIEFDVVEVKDWDQAYNQYVPGHEPEAKVSTALEFEEALAAKCPKITLLEDVVLTSDQTCVIGDLVLNLNGHSIVCERNYPCETGTTTTQRISTLYVEGVQMTIIGEGTIANDAPTSAYAITVAEGGRVTVQGNVHTRAYHDPFYVQTGELFVENGFHVSVSDTDPNPETETPYNNTHPSTVINCNDNAWSDVYVTGGTYVNMDPSDVREWKINHSSFVVEGYKVIAEPQENGDVWYIVVPE